MNQNTSVMEEYALIKSGEKPYNPPVRKVPVYIRQRPESAWVPGSRQAERPTLYGDEE